MGQITQSKLYFPHLTIEITFLLDMTITDTWNVYNTFHVQTSLINVYDIKHSYRIFVLHFSFLIPLDHMTAGCPLVSRYDTHIC